MARTPCSAGRRSPRSRRCETSRTAPTTPRACSTPSRRYSSPGFGAASTGAGLRIGARDGSRVRRLALRRRPRARLGEPQLWRPARRVATELKRTGWRLERVLADNGNEYRGQRFHETTELGARITHTDAGRPQTNGHVEALHKTILDECRRPAFARYLFPSDTGLPPRTRPLPRLVQQRPRPPPPPHQRPHPRRHPLRCPQDGGEMSRHYRHISESVHLRRQRKRPSSRRSP
jgi:hypothetical protein